MGKGEGKFFMRLENFFERAEVPEHCLHADFQRRGVGSCGIHLLRLRPDAPMHSLQEKHLPAVCLQKQRVKKKKLRLDRVMQSKVTTQEMDRPGVCPPKLTL